MKFIIAIILMVLIGFSSACTENQVAKNYGGTMTINLPKGKKLVTASFKMDDLWYLVRDMKEGEVPETLYMHEDSSFGLMQGTVVFVEQK